MQFWYEYFKHKLHKKWQFNEMFEDFPQDLGSFQGKLFYSDCCWLSNLSCTYNVLCDYEQSQFMAYYIRSGMDNGDRYKIIEMTDNSGWCNG